MLAARFVRVNADNEVGHGSAGREVFSNRWKKRGRWFPIIGSCGRRRPDLVRGASGEKALGGGASLVSRDGCAVALGESEGEIRGSQRAGVLMGDEIEPRREYIEKFAATVRDLDI